MTIGHDASDRQERTDMNSPMTMATGAHAKGSSTSLLRNGRTFFISRRGRSWVQTKMPITLTPEREAWLQSHVATGAFASIEEAARRLIDERIAERELEEDDLGESPCG
jgi:hypothetical protein